MVRERGFSLFELLIAISIMGILSLVVYPSFSKMQLKAKDASLKALVMSLQTGIETYQLSHGQYPEGDELTIVELVSQLQESGEWTKMPKNPFTGKNYTLSDRSGRIMYYLDEHAQYLLIGYGFKNQSEVIQVSNL